MCSAPLIAPCSNSSSSRTSISTGGVGGRERLGRLAGVDLVDLALHTGEQFAVAGHETNRSSAAHGRGHDRSARISKRNPRHQCERPPAGPLFLASAGARSTLGAVAGLVPTASRGAGRASRSPARASWSRWRCARRTSRRPRRPPPRWRAPLSGLPLVALPPVAGVTGQDRLGALQALAAKDPTRADVQMAIGSEQLVRGDGAAATAAFTAARQARRPARRRGAGGGGLRPEAARRHRRAAEAARADAAVRRLRARRGAAVGGPHARSPRPALTARARRGAGVVLRRQGRRSAAPDDAGRATRRSCPPRAPPAALTLADARARPRRRRRTTPRRSSSTAPRCRRRAGGRRRVAAYGQAVKADPTSVEAQVALARGRVLEGRSGEGVRHDRSAGARSRRRSVTPLPPRDDAAVDRPAASRRGPSSSRWQKEAPGTRLARLAEFFTPK